MPHNTVYLFIYKPHLPFGTNIVYILYKAPLKDIEKVKLQATLPFRDCIYAESAQSFPAVLGRGREETGRLGGGGQWASGTRT